MVVGLCILFYRAVLDDGRGRHWAAAINPLPQEIYFAFMARCRKPLGCRNKKASSERPIAELGKSKRLRLFIYGFVKSEKIVAYCTTAQYAARRNLTEFHEIKIEARLRFSPK